MKNLITVFIIAAFLLATGFCGGQGSAFAKDEYKTYGILTALSGPAAPWGIPNSRTIMMGADRINEKGGFQVKGVTYKWKTITYDHKYVPADAVKALNKAIYSDKVDFVQIMGGSPTLACIPLLKENNMLSLNDAAGGKAVTNPDNPLVFRYNPSLLAAYASILPWIKKNDGIKTMATINPDDATGKSGLWSAKIATDINKIEIVSEEFFERGSKDFAPLLTRVLAKKPDLIDTSYTDPTSSALICKQARELGFKGAILLIWGPDPKQVLKIAGKHAEGAYLGTSGPPEPRTPAQKALYERFLTKYKKEEWDPNYYTHHAVIPCLTKAIEETQSFDPDVLAKHLEDMSWDSPQGVHRFGGKKIFGIKRQLLAPITILQVKGGEPVFAATLPVPDGIFD
ncbi:MAG: ABC transporter substrate-binding protein [Proteobacteria bacterium]|nr:ABC transporter substrate-binding protein [Pseudomonadota bacterium]